MGQITYASTISKEELEQLEMLQFSGEIIVINDRDEEYFKAIEYLSNQKILGFDTETKPCFKAKAPRHNVAILQLSGPDKAYIFRLTSLGIPSELASVLSSADILKVGAAVKEDINGLNHYARFKGNGFVDLQSVVEKYGIEVKSVKKMAAIILGCRVSKAQQLSNWEAPELSEAQLRYAAIDAWSCREMYIKLTENE